MLYLVVALPCEAKPITRQLGLGRDNDVANPAVFAGDDCILVVSGVGKARAAAATAFMLTRYGARGTGVVANIGVCGATGNTHKIGQLLVINRIRDHSSDRIFLPDMLYRHSCLEAALTTCDQPVRGGQSTVDAGSVVDMEGAGFFEAAAMFVPTDLIMCLKVVSDFLDEDLKAARVTELMAAQAEPAVDILRGAAAAAHAPEPPLTPAEQDALDIAAEALRLSVTQRHMLQQLAVGYKLRTSQNLLPILEPCHTSETIDKQSRLARFGDLRRQLAPS